MPIIHSTCPRALDAKIRKCGPRCSTRWLAGSTWWSQAAVSVGRFGGKTMCRNIKILFNFDPPATDEEIRGAALQFVRKLTGFNAPSKANAAAFERAIDEVAATARRLIDALSTTATPRNREEVAAAAKARAAERFSL